MKPFRYLEELDAFVVTEEFDALATEIGLSEWHAAVWIGRLLAMDNDYGEHVFDNWDEREAIEAAAHEKGIDSHDLMIVVPTRFFDGWDGPPPFSRGAQGILDGRAPVARSYRGDDLRPSEKPELARVREGGSGSYPGPGSAHRTMEEPSKMKAFAIVFILFIVATLLLRLFGKRVP